MVKRIFIFLFFCNITIFSFDTQVKFVGNTLFVFSNEGVFRQTGPHQFEQISLNGNNMMGNLTPINDSTAYFNKANLLYITTDAGDNWTLLNTFVASITSVAAKDSVIHLTGSDYQLYSSYDCGNSWSSKPLFTPKSYTITAFRFPSNLYFYDGEASCFKSSYPYDVWEYIDADSRELNFLTSTFGYNYTTGFSITTNGGSTWNKIFGERHLCDVSAVDSLNIYFATDIGQIIKTSNSGKTWKILHQIFPAIQILSLDVHENMMAYSILNKTYIFLSYDNGLTWEQLDPGQLTTGSMEK